MYMNRWFSNAFGFIESADYFTNQSKFMELAVYGNYKTINNISIGQFEKCNLNTKYIYEKDYCPKVSLTHMIADIIDLHKDPNNANATFQVASQFNCLEMANPNAIPEHGITIYHNDRTQGPTSAKITPAGTAFRNYLMPMEHKNYQVSAEHNNYQVPLEHKNYQVPLEQTFGQTENNQLDLSLDARELIRNECGVFGNVKNGYLFYTDNELQQINNALHGNDKTEIRRRIHNSIAVGSHWNLGVFINNQLSDYTVNHVYCSGLPIRYNVNTDPIQWAGLSELFLNAIYENTLMVAAMNNQLSGSRHPCYLTLVGGGAFGMNVPQIYRAIQRACTVIARKLLSLDVILVHYRSIHPEIAKLGYNPQTFTGRESFKLSLWNIPRDKWIYMLN